MTNLDSSAIREIERLTREGQVIVLAPGEQKGVYFLRDSSGDYSRRQAKLDPQSQTAFDLDTLSTMAVHAEGIYVSDSDVVAFFDNTTTRWTASLKLPIHPAFKVLSGWRSLTGYTQAQLVRLLRTELSAYIDPTIIQTFTTLRFTRDESGTSTVKPGSQALDRNIRQQVRSDHGTEFPEKILFSVPVYDIPEAREDSYGVTVYVEFDHEEQKLQLITVHNDLRIAQELAVKAIIKDLTERLDNTVPVHYGKPS